MRFSRQEYWSGLPFPSQGIFLGSNPGLLHCRQILYQLIFKGRTLIKCADSAQMFNICSFPKSRKNEVQKQVGYCWLKKIQLESCELSFEAKWGLQPGRQHLRDCSKVSVGESQFIYWFWWRGSSIPCSTHFIKGFLLVMRIWCHHEGI